MDFTGRGSQPQTRDAVTPAAGTTSGNGNQLKKPKAPVAGKWFKLATIILLFSTTALVVALVFLLYFGNNDEGKHVDTKKYQAVFLNNGQVYFGNIKDLNRRFIDLQNIYYLQTSQNGAATNTTTSAATNVSLVKLGCELHSPYDEMVINNDQVIFWENLQDSGQVVKAIAQYKQQNPKGQNCSTQSQSSTQQAPTTSSPSQPTTTPNTTNNRTP